MIATKTIDNKYEIVREIKRGGFGVIYEGMDTILGKKVAIKAVDPALLGEAKYIDMFRDEALSVAQLNHHNIVQILDIRRDPTGQVFIIMEYIDGPDLHRLQRACKKLNRPLPIHLGVYIITEVCSGLDYAHNRRDPETQEPLHIVHQDISPTNIMISKEGEVKIIDFGMANLRRKKSARKNEVVIQGKLNYLAPEQLNGAEKLDRRVDIFALGLVLYELIKGERLIRSTRPEEVVDILKNGKWDFSDIKKLEHSEKLVLALEKSLALKPEDRYQNANQMYMDLMHYLIITAPAADFAGELAAFLQEISPALEEPFPTEPTPQIAEEVGRGTADGKATAVDDGKNDDIQQATSQESPRPAERPSDAADELLEISEQTVEHVAQQQPPHEEQEIEAETLLQQETPTADEAVAEKPPAGEEQNKAETEKTATEAEPKTRESSSRSKTSSREIKDEPVVKILDDQSTGSEASPKYFSIVEETDEDEEELKTIIDVVRLSTRTHKKAITLSLVTLIFGAILFTVVDTFAHLTSFGTTIYDFLFPPAIKIVSVPPGAQVYLDDKPLQQTTPLSIAEISPGVHKLMLTMSRFEPIVKSIHVPRKGELTIAGESKRHPSQPYVFRFKTQLELSSHPPGATIFINDVQLAEKTPATVFWEVSEEPLRLRMQYAGLPDLTGFELNTIKGTELIEDRRFWKFQRLDRVKDHFAIEGIFRKPVVIKSIPRQAEIYLDEGERPVGITGLNGTLLLTLGQHLITLRKSGYLPRQFSIEVNENTPDEITQPLLRRVRIYARDADSGDDVDIGARIVSLRTRRSQRDIDERTPAELRLLPYRYTAVLKKSGYEDLELRIPPGATRVVARMKRLPARIAILVMNAQSRNAEFGAKVVCKNLNNPQKEFDLGLTDENGSVIQEIPPGRYQVVVTKEGFASSTKILNFRPGVLNRYTFQLKPVR